MAHSKTSCTVAASSAKDQMNAQDDAKMTPVENGRIGLVVAGHDYSSTTIHGSV